MATQSHGQDTAERTGAKHTPGPWQIAGDYEPSEGEIRVVSGEIIYWLPEDARADDFGNVKVTGFLVQEYGPQYSDDGLELTGEGQWEDLCPLVDIPFLYPHLVSQLPNLRCSAIAKATGG